MSIYLGNTKLTGITEFDPVITTTGLTISASSGKTATIDSQTRIEHKAYYEYFIRFTVNGFTATEAKAQQEVGVISGFAGTLPSQLIPLSVWCNGGEAIDEACLYGSGTSDMRIIQGYTSGSNKGREYYAHFIRMK